MSFSNIPQRSSRLSTAEGSGNGNGNGNDGATVPDTETEETQMPMSMAASVMLTSLPQDTTQALKDVDAQDAHKVSVRFHPLPSTPTITPKVAKISASAQFGSVVAYVRKRLAVAMPTTAPTPIVSASDPAQQQQPQLQQQAVFLYVNSVFAPGLDEIVGNLWRCFKTDDQLNVYYSVKPAFG